MKSYIEISGLAKLELLNQHSMGPVWTSLDDQKWCLHCERKFSGSSVRVYEENRKQWLECGTPKCNGSPLDWADYPWWNENQHETKANRLRKQKG